jgi:protein gp37
MSDGTKIEWTDATWTPVKGCTRVSPGCGGPGKAGGCYAEIMAARFSKPGQWGEGLAEIVTLPDGSKDHRWTGVVRFDEAELLKPLSWRRPRKIFVCSTADLFHEKVEDEWIDRVFAVMALCPQHVFQVLTKRPERMRAWATAQGVADRVWDKVDRLCEDWHEGKLKVALPVVDGDPFLFALGAQGAAWGGQRPWPLANVWLGTSTEDQQRADERIPHLLATPAAVRFISAEPLLGPIDLTPHLWGRAAPCPDCPKDADCYCGYLPRHMLGEEPDLAWVICGGESGPGARPMHPDWARSLRDQCAAAGVPFFFKQWGEWAWAERYEGVPDTLTAYKAGKKFAGRLLDGVTHEGMPA